MKKLILFILILTSFIIFIPKSYALNVSIDNVKVFDKSDTVYANNVSVNDLKITPNVTFYSVGDYVTFKLNFTGIDIKNYKINNLTDDNDSKYIKTTYKYSEELTKPIYITMLYSSKSESNSKLGNINITLYLVDKSGKTEQIVVNNNDQSVTSSDNDNSAMTNPTTGILSHIITPLILIIISIFLVRHYTKFNGDSLTIIILILSIIPLSVMAYENQKLKLSIVADKILIKSSSDIQNSNNNDQSNQSPTTTSTEKYAVYLYPNGGSGITDGYKVAYDTIKYINEFPGVTRDNCTLVGWRVGSTSGVLRQEYVDYEENGKNLYASWNCTSSSTPTPSGSSNKILLIAGHSFSPYCNAVDNECRGKEVSGYDEVVETRAFVKELKKQLIAAGYSSDRIDIANELLGENFNDTSTSKSLYAEFVLQKAGKPNNISNIDFSKYVYAIEVHFNSSSNHNSSGVLTLCNNDTCGIAANFSSDLRTIISNTLGSPNNETYRRNTLDFTFFDSKKIPFTYLEMEYYDNKSAMDNFHNKKSSVALAMAKAIKNNYP